MFPALFRRTTILAARSASPPNRCLRSCFGLIPPAVPEVRSHTVLPASLRNVPASDSLLENFPLLFRTPLHLLLATHTASSSEAPILLFAGVQF